MSWCPHSTPTISLAKTPYCTPCELPELTATEDDVELSPLCSSCVADLQFTHKDDGPAWPSAPQRHQIV